MTEDDEDFAHLDDFKDLDEILNQKLEESLDTTSKLSKSPFWINSYFFR